MTPDRPLSRTPARPTTGKKPSFEYVRPWLADYQLDAIFNSKRYAVVEASTKAGKTVSCLIWLLEQALFTGKEGRNYWWVAPVFTQADDAYSRMKRAIPSNLYKAHEGEHTVTLMNGAVIHFKSADRPDTLYGADVWAAVVDEASRMKIAVWLAVRSTLTATRGPVRVIGNVKGRKNWAYKMGRRAEREMSLPSEQRKMHFARITAYDAVAAGILDRQEIEDAREDLTEEDFAELYLAAAPRNETSVYHAFSEENVSDEVRDTGDTVYVGMDFNVNPMTATLSNKVGNQLHTFDEIYQRNSNTEIMCTELKKRFPNRPVIVCPDASGNARRTSAAKGKTDFAIVREHGFKIAAGASNPAVSDRVNEVNRMLRNAKGECRALIHPRCKHLITSLEELEYKDGSDVPDKSEGLDHIMDAYGYCVHQLFPIIQYKVGSRELAI